MARQTINIGTNANDGTGDPLRTAFDKINDNFAELYGADGDSNTLAGNLDTNGYRIITSVSNTPIYLDPNGSGTIELVGATNVTGATALSSTLAVTGATTLSSTLAVTGAATLSTSLVLASGATVTEFSTDGTLSDNSDTAVPTEKAIKTYIDAQNQAQALTFVGDDSTGTAVNSGETFQFAGGTGLDTAVSGDTLTISIDSTVTTLTGSQVLTNKTLTSPTINGATMTGSVSIDNISINDNTISTASNADLNLQPGGTGNIVAGAVTINGTTLSSVDSAKITLAENVDVTGTLTTADITTVGTQTITGILNVDWVRIKDNQITTNATNANLELSANGTGQIIFNSDVNFPNNKDVDITGSLTVDNIDINGNTISSTTGSINLTPAAGGTVSMTVGQATEFQATLAEFGTMRADVIQNDLSDGDIQISTQGTGVVDFRTATQSTVGPVGAATHLPLDSANEIRPVGYLKVKIGGSDYVIPYFNAS